MRISIATRSNNKSIYFIDIQSIAAATTNSTTTSAFTPAAAGGQHGHRHEGGQDKGQELFHFHDVHLTLLRGSTDMRPGGAGSMTPPYVVSIVSRFSPFRHKFVTTCIFVVIFCRVGAERASLPAICSPFPRARQPQTRPRKTKPPADVVSPPGVYMQGSADKHSCSRARLPQWKAVSRARLNCVKSIS